MRLSPSVRSRLAFLGLSALLISGVLAAPQKSEQPTWVSGDKRAAFEPTACIDADGRLWALWTSTDRAAETTASIGGVCMLDGRVLAELELEDSGQFPAVPQVAKWKRGVYLVWEAGGDGERALFGRELRLASSRKAIELGPPERVPTGAHKPLVPRLAARADSLVLVYQGLNGENYDLYAQTRDAKGWSASEALTNTAADEWSPRIAVDAADGLHLAWDYFDGESYDIVYSRYVPGQPLAPVVVAGGSTYQGSPELSVNARGEAWIAWEACAHFGESGGLRSERELGLAKVSSSVRADGTSALVAAEIDASTLDAESSRREFARPLVSPSGLLLTYISPVRGGRKRDHLYTAWMTSLLAFERGASRERTLPLTDGGSDPDSVLVTDPSGGQWLVFSADRRREEFKSVSSWSDSIERRPRVAVLRLNEESGFPKLGATRELAPLALPAPKPSAEPAQPRVLWGDLHRHTHLSRCSGSKDGTLLDAYRYARGPGQLDFIAITDHFQHMKPWSWYRSRRDVIRYHAPGSLVALCGVERVRAKRGHYNDIYFDPSEVPFDVDTWMRPPARFAPAPAEHVIAIPHMMAVDDGTGFDWDEFDEDRTRLFEIYQGKRGSYEGQGLPFEADDEVEEPVSLERGFERGAHFGLIASSDHLSSATSYAGLYAAELTRESVFEALRDRHCFAATVERAVDARLGSLQMGDAGEVSGQTRFRVLLDEDSARDVAYVELVKNGRTAQRAAGAGDLESWVVTLRRVPLISRGEMTVELEGGRFESATPRRPGSPGLQLVDVEERLVRFRRTDFVLIDLAVTIRWDPQADVQALTFRAGDVELRLPRDGVEPGRSFSLIEGDLRALAWRQGAALEVTGGEVGFDIEARVGDSYYARIAWTDGNLAWTSPIRIRRNEDQ